MESSSRSHKQPRLHLHFVAVAIVLMTLAGCTPAREPSTTLPSATATGMSSPREEALSSTKATRTRIPASTNTSTSTVTASHSSEPTATTTRTATKAPTSTPSNTATITPTETLTPTAIATATPTNTPTAIVSSIQEFSLQEADSVVPEDILDEVVYFTTGGGGPPACDEFDRIALNRNLSTSLVVEVGDRVEFETCGWQVDELVSTTMLFPGGDPITETNLARNPGGAFGYGVTEFQYDVELNAPVGEYHFIAEGVSQTLEAFVVVVPARGPRIMIDREPEEQETSGRDLTHVYLFGFQPHENVRVFAYEAVDISGAHQLKGWKSYQADTTGSLTIVVNASTLPLGPDSELAYAYEAVGENSGQAQPPPTRRGGEVNIIIDESVVSFNDLAVGDCFNVLLEGDTRNIPLIPCDEPHDNEVYAILDYPEDTGLSYLDQVELLSTYATEKCLASFESYVGLPYQQSELSFSRLFPTWAEEDREIVCTLYDPTGRKLLGSMVGSAR